MKRRNFIKTTSCVTVGALLPNSNIIYGTEKKYVGSTFHTTENSHIKIDGNTMFIETKTLNAILEKGIIISLRCKQTGQEYIRKQGSSINL